MSKTSPYFAYIRVSTVKQGQKGVSLQEQRDAIERFATQQGITINEWFEETETAAKRGRPIFGRMIKGLRSGKAQGLIIHKIDRGARNYRDWADLGELIDSGVDVKFAAESLDMFSRGGRLSADIQAVVAADYIRNLREETRKGFYGRLKQGLYPLPAPIGYLDKGKGEPKEIDPIRGPIVAQLFNLYATGEYSLHDLRKEAISMGLTNKKGGRVSINGLSTMLNNPFYMGLMRIRTTGEVFEGIHVPLIKHSTFQAIKDILAGKNKKKIETHQFIYSRLLKCLHCGYSLIGERQKGHTYYRCHQRECVTKGIREEAVDQSIRAQLKRIEFDGKEEAIAFGEVERMRSLVLNERKEIEESCTLRLAQVDERLDRLTDALLDGDIDRAVFNRRKEKLLQENRELEEKLSLVAGDGSSLIDQIIEYLELCKMASQSYMIATLPEKREMLQIITSNRFVDRKNVVVKLSMPFSIIAEREALPCGDPFRGIPRTWRVICAELVKYLKEI